MQMDKKLSEMLQIELAQLSKMVPNNLTNIITKN